MPITRAYIVRHNFGSANFFNFKDAEDNLRMTEVEGREAGKFEITTDLVNFEFGYGGVFSSSALITTRTRLARILVKYILFFFRFFKPSSFTPPRPEVNFFPFLSFKPFSQQEKNVKRKTTDVTTLSLVHARACVCAVC